MPWPVLARGSARVPAAVLASLLLALLVGCMPADEPDGRPSEGTASSPPEVEYRPGRAATVRLPEGDPRAVVVLVPGGGWASADPSGLGPLADALAGGGDAVVTITYGNSSTQDVYPVPPQDVACAVGFAATEVPGVPVVLVGHSAGAHLSALVGLVPDQGDDDCPHTPAEADGVVGLAGPYDVAGLTFAVQLFGTDAESDPDTWTEGNPLTWVAERPGVPFLLLHGTDDGVVPASQSEAFAAELEASGHDVDLELVDGAGHMDVIEPEVVADLITSWVPGASG